jgi:hypothetical protein
MKNRFNLFACLVVLSAYPMSGNAAGPVPCSGFPEGGGVTIRFNRIESFSKTKGGKVFLVTGKGAFYSGTEGLETPLEMDFRIPLSQGEVNDDLFLARDCEGIIAQAYATHKRLEISMSHAEKTVTPEGTCHISSVEKLVSCGILNRKSVAPTPTPSSSDSDSVSTQ